MKISPTLRISVGLVLLTLSILMLADLAGLAPDHTREILDKRKKVSESLAIEFSLAAQHGHFEIIAQTLEAIVDRNDDIVSAGLRNAAGKLLAQAGDHATDWQYDANKVSTPTHIIVPIFEGDKKWGNVEIQFTPLVETGFLGIALSPVTKLLLFVSLLGFAGYAFLMHRTLRYLSPSSVVPGRVQFALDALRSGVVLIDNDGSIVLANMTFSESHESTPEALLGKMLDEFEWRNASNNRKLTTFPWKEAIAQAKPVTGSRVRINPAGKPSSIYIVNCTPILDANQKSRGALVSFEDITKIQMTNEKLRKTLGDLEESRDKIEKQNQKLTVLATRDSMTGCLNRRFFFEQFETQFVDANQQEHKLSCIMTDIDHFKNINDSHGHLFGDQVIKAVAEILETESRSVDLICRYGGEEFCILMPNLARKEAEVIAERLRFSIEKLVRQRLEKDVPVTSSFGVACSEDGAASPLKLVSQADQALYAAKTQGRNRVVSWQPELDEVPEKAADDTPQNESVDTENNIADETGASVIAETSDDILEPINVNIGQLQHRIFELENIVEQQSRELLLRTAYDSLTGLPNRVLFQDRVTQAIARAKRAGQKISIVSLDIEAFKRIHDTLGNSIADELVRKVSGHLTEILRSTDTIAILNQNNSRTTVSRINVDEFGILITDLETVEPITWIIKRIFDVLEKRADIDKHEIYLNSCIGVSLYPNDGTTAEALINNASAARYSASRQPGTNRYQYYSPELNTTSTHHIKLESELCHAMKDQALELYYQPKVNIYTGVITGVEALLRWNHPARGMIPPHEFIQIAERSGLINELGEQVLRMACRQAKIWTSTIAPDLTVSVNLSPIQLRQPNLFRKINAILEESGLAPYHLELEITESAAISCVESAIENARQFQSAGIRVSLDDFGTGFSSLSQLNLLPVDTLKIDRSFIAELSSDSDNLSIVAAIIAMSHKLGLTVLAEGVETVDQLELLRRLKCDEIQGYLFSMPLPVDDVSLLLDSGDNRLEIVAKQGHETESSIA